MNYIITGLDYTSTLFEKINCKNLSIMRFQELKEKEVFFEDDDKIYVPSESALDEVLHRIKSNTYKSKINGLKDKYEFRVFLQDIFPDFYFNKTELSNLEKIALPEKKLIFKPKKGFFGTAVKEFIPGDNIHKIVQEMQDDLKAKSQFFSNEILSHEEIIIEEYAEGEELAVDMYFNNFGEPVILNIYVHPNPKRIEYFHVLYYTNKDVFDRFYKRIITFFKNFNEKFIAKNFPIHAEFKFDGKDIVPIEMNPLRFGGFGLADLTYYSYGFNPFEAFFKNMTFDFETFWDENKNANFGWVLAYNGAEIDLMKYEPDYKRYYDMIGDSLHNVKLDYQSNPVFAISYLRKENFEELEKLLEVEFNNFFKKKGNDD